MQRNSSAARKKQRNRPTLVKLDEPIVVGVCAMDKKTSSKAMEAILSRLTSFAPGEFKLVIFGDEVILNQPIERWPVVECLISFFSDGFPLKKAEAYVELVKPSFVVNDLTMQHLLLDRRRVYNTLLEHGIPVPRHVVVDRDSGVRAYAPTAAAEDAFEETEEYVRVGSTRLDKPFVEKPVNAEDHNVCIYYGHTLGGGMKRLFRKVGNQASAYVEPPVDEPYVRVRRHGSFLYEDFMSTGGTDVKVYTVGPDYAHAEARKSPVVDGRVMRDENGKEVRYPVVLTPEEKEIARRVVLAFGQAVCGFDLLRCKGRSYVCDVNGWSFVKGSAKYYDDAAVVLRAMILAAVAPHHTSTKPAEAAAAATTDGAAATPSYRRSESERTLLGDAATEEGPAGESCPTPPPLARRGSGISLGAGACQQEPQEELRCVLAVIRHGDRTPKQKMKLKVTDARLLDLICQHNGGRPRKQVKLKRPAQLQELLDVARAMVNDKQASGRSAAGPPAPGSSGGGDDWEEELEKLRQVVAVLEEGGHFSGINRKAQLKPLAWAPAGDNEETSAAAPFAPSSPAPGVADGDDGGDPVCASAAPEGREQVTQALLILKFGGVLTPLGRAQAEALGRNFREQMYPPGEDEDGSILPGLLRLHSTYRHDLKIYSSDEGRVQMSAAAFAKGLLDLETPKVRDGGAALAPILASLVIKDAKMLDFITNEVADDIACAKDKLYTLMTEGARVFRGTKAMDSSSGGSEPEDIVLRSRHKSARVAAAVMLAGTSAPIAIAARSVAEDGSGAALSAQLAAWTGMGNNTSIRNSRTDLSSLSGPTTQHEDEVGGAGTQTVTTVNPPVAACSVSPGRTGLYPLAEEAAQGGSGDSVLGEGGPPDGDWLDPPSPEGAPLPHSLLSSGYAEAVTDPFLNESAVRNRPKGSSVESAVLCRPPGVPLDPLRSLHRMLALLKALTRQLSGYCRNASALSEAEGWAERLGPLAPGTESSSPSLVSPPASSSLVPAGGESFLLLHARWKKLERDCFSHKKRRFDISKVPDVYDSAKYDAIHNAHLRLEALPELLPLAKLLADGVVPNEYGTHPHSKLRIGGTIARDLVKKLLVDLGNTREETFRTTASAGLVATDAPGSEPEACNISGWQRQVMAERGVRVRGAAEHAMSSPVKALRPARSEPAAAAAAAAAAAPSEGAADDAEGDGVEAYSEDEEEELSSTRLHPGWGATDVNSPHRHVRTRVYFTSESHIHSLMSVLRYCHLEPPPESTGTAEPDAPQQPPPPVAHRAPAPPPAAFFMPSGIPVAQGGGAPTEACLGDPYVDKWWYDTAGAAAAAATAAAAAAFVRRQQPLLSPQAEALLLATSECDYLTHIVIRMYERLDLAATDPRRFRLEVAFSRGAAVDWSVARATPGGPLPESAYTPCLMHREALQNDGGADEELRLALQESPLTLDAAEQLLWRFTKVRLSGSAHESGGTSGTLGATPSNQQLSASGSFTTGQEGPLPPTPTPTPKSAAAVSLLGRLGSFTDA